MFALPDPLHPAIVHFPIVLIVLGTSMALVSVFVQRWHLPWLGAFLLGLGAAGAIAAVWTGEEDQEILGSLSSQAEEVLDTHEEWGARTRNMALAAALVALASAGLVGRFPRMARGLSLVTALLAIGSSYGVIQTGHYGGQLVYKHGAGVNLLAGANDKEKPSKHAED